MPELPEVTTIANQLREEIRGFTIKAVNNFDSYRPEPEFPTFKKEVEGKEVDGVERVAKTIVLKLKSEPAPSYLVFHLAMTGRLLLKKEGDRTDPWTRLVFRLIRLKRKIPDLNPSDPGSESPVGNGGLTKELRFCDARLFGYVHLLGERELAAHKNRYGPDALALNLSPDVLLLALRKKKIGVKKALLEQAIIAGVGNIYANESLWLAEIHPETLTSELTEAQVSVLLTSLREVLKESIAHRGSTLGDKMYLDLYGREGTHQNHFRIFGKAGRPCPRCRAEIRHEEIGGRGTFYCPRCQVRRAAGAGKFQGGQPAPMRLPDHLDLGLI